MKNSYNSLIKTKQPNKKQAKDLNGLITKKMWKGPINMKTYSIILSPQGNTIEIHHEIKAHSKIIKFKK